MDEFSLDPRFLELQEELRSVLLDSTKQPEPEPASAAESEPGQSQLDLSRVPIPKIKMASYLKNWIVECAPYLDKFDEERHFGIHVPLLAKNSPALLYATLAFSARQMERKAYPQTNHDSLQLYQESIRLLASSLPTKDPDMLVTACILAVLELMSGNPHSWRRHIEGCASLFDLFGVNGLSGGLLQAVFWCYARMELCGAIISRGAESTVLPLEKWTPPIAGGGSLPKHLSEDLVKGMFLEKIREAPSMHANWAVYLCARACDLLHRRTRQLELGAQDETDTRSFFDQWHRLWADLQYWLEARPLVLQPARRAMTDDSPLFPVIIFNHWAAISSTQAYHAACILMLEVMPPKAVLSAPYNLATWHARRICGISRSNPHYANLINSIQPLYLAGKLLSHPSEHIEIARILKFIETATGWGALWRLRDLELEWGYEPNEILNAI